jgi:hypothetical protein
MYCRYVKLLLNSGGLTCQVSFVCRAVCGQPAHAKACEKDRFLGLQMADEGPAEFNFDGLIFRVNSIEIHKDKVLVSLERAGLVSRMFARHIHFSDEVSVKFDALRRDFFGGGERQNLQNPH